MFLINEINESKSKVFGCLVLCSYKNGEPVYLLKHGCIPTKQIQQGKTSEDTVDSIFAELTGSDNKKWTIPYLSMVHDNPFNTVQDERAIYLIYYNICPYFESKEYEWVDIKDLIDKYPDTLSIVLDIHRRIKDAS